MDQLRILYLLLETFRSLGNPHIYHYELTIVYQYKDQAHTLFLLRLMLFHMLGTTSMNHLGSTSQLLCIYLVHIRGYLYLNPFHIMDNLHICRLQ